MRARIRNEEGQTLIIVALAMLILLGFCALVLDIGHAYLAQRRLQSSVDAAALAGADALPNIAQATADANWYGNGGKNTPAGVDTVTMTVSTKCLPGLPGGCTTANAVTVKETGSIPTLFGGLFGVSNLNVHADATACSPCGAKPLDIMLVLDRTGSMCTKPDGSDDHPTCQDMENAREGIKTFLGLMDPQLDHVGLAVLPPAPPTGAVCGTRTSPFYKSPNDRFVVVPLSSDYSSGGVLDPSSALVSTIDCVRANGSTAYANALESAQAELLADGRPNTQKVIVLLSDGAANTGPTDYPAGSPYLTTPCHQGINSSATIQSSGTLVYSIGYDVGHDVCKNANGSLESPGITALSALQQIASSGNFYNQPDAAQLNTIFTKVAVDLLQGTSRLIDDNS
jgi:Putative Flp pilus-assembly TadE/G-like/von Willebrand factor type A domain